MAISIETLKKLAGRSDDLSPLISDALPENIKQALAEAQADEMKSAAKEAAGEIIKLIKAANTAIELNVTNIRSARKTIDSAKAKIDEIARAREYALETNNWFPLIMLVSDLSFHEKMSLKEDDVVTKVPENWKPKTATSAPAKKVTSPKK